MGWQPRHWKKVEEPFNRWAGNQFMCSETLLNLAGNTFSPYTWIAVQMALLATQGCYKEGDASGHRQTPVAIADDGILPERKFEDSTSEGEASDDDLLV